MASLMLCRLRETFAAALRACQRIFLEDTIAIYIYADGSAQVVDGEDIMSWATYCFEVDACRNHDLFFYRRPNCQGGWSC
jgi:hypothetical protein